MNELRSLRLQQAADEVRRIARFRHPQTKSFDAVRAIIEALYDDLADLSDAEFDDQLAGLGYVFDGPYPDFQFALATGVGKRRLMGAIAAYLIRSRQTQNVVILAPRTAILDRLERDVFPNSPDYLFLDATLVPDPNVCLRGSIETFRPDERRANIFVLSPQTVLGSRIQGVHEFHDESLLDYLRSSDDLVVLSDEAHHIGDMDSAWGRAVADLQPKLHFGFSATPRSGAVVLHSYGLAECLSEGRFTKAVDILAKKREEGVSDEQWDHQTLDYVLARLETKQAALEDLRVRDQEFPRVQAVALVCARDTEHAETIGDWLRRERGLTAAEVHVTHSNRKQTEHEIVDLVALDRPGNETRVVVHVERLSEGWDVTNVFVVAPLRTMGTYQLAVQTLGRGLRLPSGHRTGDDEVDTLDVVCFGRESAQEILEQAKADFRDGESDSSVIGVRDAEEAENREQKKKVKVTFKVVRPYTFQLPRVEGSPSVPDLDFEPDVSGRLARDIVTKIALGRDIRATHAEAGLTYTLGRVRVVTAARIFEQLNFLSEWRDADAVAGLVEKSLQQLGVDDDVSEDGLVYIDPLRLAVALTSQIARRWRDRPASFDVIEGDRVVRLADMSLLVDEGDEEPVAPKDVVVP